MLSIANEIDPLFLIFPLRTLIFLSVYSFGIVALELAYGRKLVDHRATEDQIVMLD